MLLLESAEAVRRRSCREGASVHPVTWRGSGGLRLGERAEAVGEREGGGVASTHIRPHSPLSSLKSSAHSLSTHDAACHGRVHTMGALGMALEAAWLLG